MPMPYDDKEFKQSIHFRSRFVHFVVVHANEKGQGRGIDNVGMLIGWYWRVNAEAEAEGGQIEPISSDRELRARLLVVELGN